VSSYCFLWLLAFRILTISKICPVPKNEKAGPLRGSALFILVAGA
jgi:hypothetical protein